MPLLRQARKFGFHMTGIDLMLANLPLPSKPAPFQLVTNIKSV